MVGGLASLELGAQDRLGHDGVGDEVPRGAAQRDRLGHGLGGWWGHGRGHGRGH